MDKADHGLLLTELGRHDPTLYTRSSNQGGYFSSSLNIPFCDAQLFIVHLTDSINIILAFQLTLK